MTSSTGNKVLIKTKLISEELRKFTVDTLPYKFKNFDVDVDIVVVVVQN